MGEIWVIDLHKTEHHRAVGRLNGPVELNEINNLQKTSKLRTKRSWVRLLPAAPDHCVLEQRVRCFGVQPVFLSARLSARLFLASSVDHPQQRGSVARLTHLVGRIHQTRDRGSAPLRRLNWVCQRPSVGLGNARCARDRRDYARNGPAARQTALAAEVGRRRVAQTYLRPSFIGRSACPAGACQRGLRACPAPDKHFLLARARR